jgi:crotonobetainyl-CoA:carnitine CoA-transferase CaiB-like acyl-CoA transferase
MFAAEAIKESDRKKFGLHNKINGSEPHSRYYRCRDGQWVALNAIQKKHWDTFCEVVDREAWKPRHEDPTLVAEVDQLFLDAPSTYWEALAQSRELCLMRVIPWGEHVSFTQARPQLATDPLTWCGFAPYPGLKAAPELGEDTFSVLHSLGISHKQIGEWIKGGVAFQKEGGLKDVVGR